MPARAPVSEEDIVDAAKLHDKHVNSLGVLNISFLDLSGLGFLGMGAAPSPPPPTPLPSRSETQPPRCPVVLTVTIKT